MDEPLDTDVAIEAPEHIVFRHVVAGPARRALAQLIDLVVCYGAVLAVSILVILVFSGFAGFRGAYTTVSEASTGVILVVIFAAQWLYSFLWEGFTGRSPGKIALDLRVVMVSGRPIGFAASALRNVLRAADALPGAYLVGVTAMALNARFQRLGDLVAGTMVIVAGKPKQAAPLFLEPPLDAVEAAVLPSSVTLDQRERAAIELFLRRRVALGRARSDELATILMAPMSARFGFRLPDPTRTLAVLYDRAVNVGRGEAPASTRWPSGAVESPGEPR